MSSTITIRVSDEEKEFIKKMATFYGLSVSELSRKQLLEALEDQIDLNVYKEALQAHKAKDESISLQEMKRVLE
ncbi:type II toxin-antitoxin system RelB family antitoxin [Listeria aquatica]|uniref:CopG/DNA-binding domain-containing protein n=1 Tax=Listeria aquatica FSL S10-1188 TaxID=1265818 RepID=W7B1M2_9LIST|nr:DUF6290 family protein [Listeria aquatica]EUJ16596.1 CopG/DNA-binding domain-containing protein [Listeria aquatica FSL S10-1188]